MKKNYLIALFALVCNFAFSQVQVTAYKGAFAPAPAAMWTDTWTNFNPNQASYGAVTDTLRGDITSNKVLDKTKVYDLQGLVTVRNNATLTIPAGTVIRANVQASALVITRGSKLIANGTAAEPIVFTSKNIAGSRSRGDWGGIVLLGKAKYNINNGENYIEGLSQNVNTQFGGGLSPIDDDNSGSLKYVRIEFAGYVFSPNNELNGLTMGAVGSGTTIDYVQVSYSNDDSFEWFGGSVNCKHLVAFNGLDDDFDTDNGYKGIVQFGLSIKDPIAADISTSECFESDNNALNSSAGLPTPSDQSWGNNTSATFTNFTCIGGHNRPTPTGFVSPNSLHDKALRVRRFSQLSVYNSIFLDFKTGFNLESSGSLDGFIAGTLKFKNNIIASPTPFKTASTTGWTTSLTAVTNKFVADNTGFVIGDGTNNTVNGVVNATVSSGILTRPYATDAATNYLTITGSTDSINIDYRPLSDDAKTGASFTDLSSLTATGSAPGVSNVTYCKGAIASALTANMTSTGVSLKWYSKHATTNVYTLLPSAPTPKTTTVGSIKYGVSELNANNVESAKADITVTISPISSTVLQTITGPSAPAVKDVSNYIGTATEVTYTVPSVTLATGESYFWTVPLGASINAATYDATNLQLTGQGTNTILVKFTNVPAGLFKVGDVTVGIKVGQCTGKVSKISLTAKLPTASSKVVMTNGAYVDATTSVAITSFAKYMGTTTQLTLTAIPSASPTMVPASSYLWELPTEVNLVTGSQSGDDDIKFYNAYPFTVSVSRPSSVGNVYYQVITKTYPNGLKVATASKFVVGGKLAGSAGNVAPVGGFMATSATDTTPTTNQNGSVGVFKANDVGVSFTAVEGVTVNPAYPINVSTSNSINVNFAAANSSSTVLLYVGARTRNGVGASVSNNASPNAASKAKLLKLTAAAPAKVTKILKDGSTTVLANATSERIQTVTTGTTIRTYDIVASPFAQEYVVTPPTGCFVNNLAVNADATITDLTFTITYPISYTSTSAAPKLLKVAAKNIIGTSATLDYKILSTTAVYVPKFNDETPISLVSNIEMYPNPASEVVNFNIDATSNGVIEITIYSFDGKMIMESKALKVENGINSFTQNVSNLSKGIYLVRITSSTSNEVVTKKLIKN
ncbi:MAG: T9SS type A sorting domain-containing protein [Flavobacterium sp.]|nr:T9SS type A sorting domain-containing protein [Flavobacterium sp.]